MKNKTQDPKFYIEDNRLVGQSGPIPEDEPIFILRARDYNAVETLKAYLSLAEKTLGAVTGDASETKRMIDRNYDHVEAVMGRILDFVRFSNRHQDRMKVPDTDLNLLHDGKP